MYLMIEYAVNYVVTAISSLPTFELIAQAISIVAMAFNILSFQQKSSKGVILMQLCGGALFATSFLMIGSYVGGLLNTLAVFRAVVFANEKRFKAKSIFWLYTFIFLFMVTYLITFTVFGTNFTLKNAIIEVLPVIAMTASTISYRFGSASKIRAFWLISSPSWLIYNCFAFNIGAILCETFSICSIIIGVIRLDIKKDRS